MISAFVYAQNELKYLYLWCCYQFHRPSSLTLFALSRSCNLADLQSRSQSRSLAAIIIIFVMNKVVKMMPHTRVQSMNSVPEIETECALSPLSGFADNKF